MNNIFNQDELLFYRNLAAKNFHQYNFLKKELGLTLLERLNHARGDFPTALDLNSHTGEASELLAAHPKVKKVISTDIAEKMLQYSTAANKVLADPSNLPFSDNYFNLVMSVWGLHSLNNFPLVLNNIYRVLKPGGLILLCMPCYGNLSNLSNALYEAEALLYPNEVINRVHPFMDVKTLGNLVKDAGFTSVIADKEQLIIMYQSVHKLLKDLRGTGEHNVLINKSKKLLPLAFYSLLLEKLEKIKDKTSNHYPINVEVCNIMAWKP